MKLVQDDELVDMAKVWINRSDLESSQDNSNIVAPNVV